MTKDEAQTVVSIMAEADGGCGNCAISLLKKFVKAFPDTIRPVQIFELLKDKYYWSEEHERKDFLEEFTQ